VLPSTAGFNLRVEARIDVKVTTQRPEPGVAELTVELPQEAIDAAIEKALKRIAARTSVAGFRRGKAPRALVERQVGQTKITEEAINHLVPEAYDEAVAQEGLFPIDRPRFEITSATPGEPLVFTATVPLRPEVTLGDYASLVIERPTLEVTDDQVENVIKQLKESRAQWTADESARAKVGAMIVADIVMDLDPSDAEGRRKTERKASEIIVGENGFPAGFDGGVDGMGAGDTRSFAVIWQGVPATKEDGTAGVEDREALFTVTVHEVRTKHVPDVDDEFAHDVTGGAIGGLDALYADIRQRLAFEATRRGHSEVENLAVDAAIAASQFEIPQALISLETNYLAEEERSSLEKRRLTVERYLQLTGQSIESWREQLAETAVRQIRARTLLDAVAEKEGIVVSTEEVDAEVAATAAQFPNDAKQARRELNSADSRRRIGASLRRHKAIEKLVGFVGGYPTLSVADAGGREHEHGHNDDQQGDSSSGSTATD
jgi:trigger factor